MLGLISIPRNIGVSYRHRPMGTIAPTIPFCMHRTTGLREMILTGIKGTIRIDAAQGIFPTFGVKNFYHHERTAPSHMVSRPLSRSAIQPREPVQIDKTSTDISEKREQRQQLIKSTVHTSTLAATQKDTVAPPFQPPVTMPTPTVSSIQQPDKEPPGPPSKHQTESSDDHHPPPTKVFEDAPISPPEDVKTYGDLIRKVASALSLSISKPLYRVNDIIFEVLNRDVSAPVSLPLSLVLLQ